MTSPTHPKDILLHKVPDDPVRCRLAAVIAAAGPQIYLADAARAAGLDFDTAAAVLGFRVDTDFTDEGDVITVRRRVVPDGVRACYRGECPHEDGYVPEP